MTTIFIIQFVIYLAAMGYLGYRGQKKTTDMKSFAVSSGDVNPYVAGITWAATFMSAEHFWACRASRTATACRCSGIIWAIGSPRF